MAMPELRENVTLATLTSWRVGGPARYFAEPTSVDELKALLSWVQTEKLPWLVIGKGSNLLIADSGFPGLVIRLGDKFGAVSVENGLLRAQAGCSTMNAIKAGAQAGFGGAEFLSSIPGTIGGTVYMNAGAHGGCVADVLVEATLLLPDGTIIVEPASALDFRYRYSNVRERGAVVLEAVFRMQPKEASVVQEEMKALSKWRRERQPQGLSAGSVFTNPPMASAGKLIEDAGLKGETLGKAQVSPVHANFIVNLGGATAADVNALICRIQERIHAIHGFWLHPEVRGVGLDVGHPEARRDPAQAGA
ncbi:UDP-N-acetylenolpyruvoylglucosamine reductase [compost metagenome]